MSNQRVERWVSNKGDEEIHHFVEGKPNTYLFGFNRKLLGYVLYQKVKQMVEERLNEIRDI